MPHRYIKAGDPVIINDCDEPSAKMIVVVTEVSADCVSGFYLNARKRKEYRKLCRSGRTLVHSPLQGRTRATHIGDFGMKIVVEGEQYSVVESGEPCVAIYPDGVPRKWQDRNNGRWHLADRRSLERLKL